MATDNIMTYASADPDVPAVNTITRDDLLEVLSKGVDDFKQKPSHIFLLVLLYPIIGLIAARVAAGYEMLPIVFPLISGFALVGPLAAIGVYEMSRRREAGLDVSWADALNVVRSPSIGAIMMLSALVGLVYFAWLAAAMVIYWSLFGSAVPETIGGFANQILTTPTGWLLIILGCGVGFVFALAVLAMTAVSFPMLLDRQVSAVVAIRTSVRVFKANPKTMLIWGMIVTAGLVLGSVPFFIGLAVTMPILGHATWHLYKKVVQQ